MDRSDARRSIAYRPEIDGLRAIAVIGVILFHLDFAWLPGGFSGVDVFFVISGYLITSIVAKETRERRFRWREFWMRRIRRLMPAFLAMTLVLLGVSRWLIFKGDHPRMGVDLLASLFWVANVVFYRFSGDYWGPIAEDSTVLHTWTLSLEEQFYLFLPILLWWCLVKAKWNLRRCLLGVGAISFGCFVYCLAWHPEAAFYLLPTRAWEFAIGAMIASAVGNQERRISHPFVDRWKNCVGLAMVLIGFVWLERADWRLVVPVLGTALLLIPGAKDADCSNRTIKTKHPFPLSCRDLLSHSILTTIGKWSYSLYLWHWPVIVIAKQLQLPSRFPNAWCWIVVLVFGLLSLLSYYMVEKPFRHRGWKLWPLAIGFVVSVLGSFWLLRSDGLYDVSEFEESTTYARYYSIGPNQRLDEDFNVIQRTVAMPASDAAPDAYFDRGLLGGAQGNGDDIDLVVFGDSHACMWSRTIHDICLEEGLAASFWSVAAVDPFCKVPPTLGRDSKQMTADQRLHFDEARIKRLRQWKPAVVIICMRWDSSMASRTSRSDDLMRLLGEIGAKVFLIEQPSVGTFGNRNAVQHFCFLGGKPFENERQYLPISDAAAGQRARQRVRTIADQYDFCEVIETYDLYQRDGQMLIVDGRHGVYLDDDHLLEYGANFAKDRIADAIKRSVSTSLD